MKAFYQTRVLIGILTIKLRVSKNKAVVNAKVTDPLNGTVHADTNYPFLRSDSVRYNEEATEWFAELVRQYAFDCKPEPLMPEDLDLS